MCTKVLFWLVYLKFYFGLEYVATVNNTVASCTDSLRGIVTVHLFTLVQKVSNWVM